jgi:hypothetical protein
LLVGGSEILSRNLARKSVNRGNLGGCGKQENEGNYVAVTRRRIIQRYEISKGLDINRGGGGGGIWRQTCKSF